MSSFVYATDLHLTDKQPVNRVTPVYPNCLHKFDAILSMARANGRTLVLGGDLFDTPCPSYTLLEETINLLDCYRDLQIYLVRGNHDLKYLNDFQSTGVSALHSARLLHILARSVIVGNFQLLPVPYSRELPVTFVQESANPKASMKYSMGTESYSNAVHDHDVYEDETKGKKLFNIMIAHMPIVTEPVPYPHMLCENIYTDVDVLLCGHIHMQFNKTLPSSAGRGFTQFVNPGCITRLKRNEADIVPSVAVVSCTSHAVTCKIVPIDKAGKVEFLAEEQEVVSFDKAEETKKIDIDDVTTYIQSSGYPEPVRTEALNLVKEKQGEVVSD